MISPQYVDGLELRIKELEQWQRDSWRRVAERLEGEKQALAAHVERLHRVWVDAKRCVSVVAFPSLYRVEQYQSLAKASIKKVEATHQEVPATSLARLKAEALTDFAKWAQNDLTLDGLFINFDELIKRYRRQAEEAS